MMSIDESSNQDAAEERRAARRFRSLIQVGADSPVTGTLDRAYFVNLERELRERAAKS